MNTNEPTTPSAAPTPETDAHIKDKWPEHFVATDFAQRLERERDETPTPLTRPDRAGWWCDDGVRHVSRVAMDILDDDGPCGYYLYGGTNPGWIYFA